MSGIGRPRESYTTVSTFSPLPLPKILYCQGVVSVYRIVFPFLFERALSNIRTSRQSLSMTFCTRYLRLFIDGSNAITLAHNLEARIE